MGIDARMFARTRAKVTQDDVKRWAYQMCAAFGREEFSVIRPGEYAYLKDGQRALEIVKVWEQDGPDIKPKKGETFIECHLYTRYWGPGYERGNLPLILGVAQWLELRIPGAEVWYGGDSSGVCAEHFDEEMRRKFLAHFASDDGADYRTSFLPSSNAPHCEFCDVRMTACRWGAGGDGYACLGCGLHWLNGKTAVGHWPGEEKR